MWDGEVVLGLGIPRDNPGRKESQELFGPASKTRFLTDLSSLTWKTSKDRNCAMPLGYSGAPRIPNNSHFGGEFHWEFTWPVLKLPELLDGLEKSGIVGIVPGCGWELGLDDP